MLKIVLLFFLLTLNGCNLKIENEDGMDMTSTPGDRRITHSQARAWMEEYPDAVILDVRSAEEFATGYITGAVLLPLNEVEARAEEVISDKNALVLVYCRSGNRSHTATMQLLYMGYRVFDFGGIIDWPYGKTYP
jgi:rhodanese-related sulfurtransferase